MTDTKRHDLVEQLLPAAALEILEGEELLQVTSHVRECADCAHLLESYREAVAGIGTSLPDWPLQPDRSDVLRARLLSRAARSRFSSPHLVTKTRRGWALVERWGGWAIAAGLAGLLLIHHSIHRPLAYGWLAAGLLVLVVIALAGYLMVQSARLAELRRKLEQETAKEMGPPDGSGLTSTALKGSGTPRQ